MNELLKVLIEKLPTRLVATVLVIVLVWFGFLTAVALLTNRSVDFFPPHIGTDKALLVEIQGLSSQVTRLQEKEQAQRAKLLEIVVKAREESISLQRSMSFGTTDASMNVSKSEEALRTEDEKFLLQVEELQQRVQKLSNRL